MRVLPQISVTTDLDYRLLYGVKFLRVTVGSADVQFSFNYDISQIPKHDFMTLVAGTTYYFSAPKGKLFYIIFFRTTSGTSTLDVVACDSPFEMFRFSAGALVITPSTSIVNNDIVVNIGGKSTFNVGQVSVGTSATTIRASNANRKRLLIKNIGTDAVYIGGSTVTTTTGYKLGVGEEIELRTTATVYGIATATQTVCYIEE